MPTHDLIAQARQHIEKALIEKAMADSAFRKELKANPHAALKALLGTDPIPAMKITVVEEAPGEAVLVLPRSIAQDELPDELLDFASGGTKFSTFLEYGKDGRPIGGSMCK